MWQDVALDLVTDPYSQTENRHPERMKYSTTQRRWRQFSELIHQVWRYSRPIVKCEDFAANFKLNRANLPKFSFFQWPMSYGLKSFGWMQQGSFCSERPYPTHETVSNNTSRNKFSFCFWFFFSFQMTKKTQILSRKCLFGYDSDGS